MGFENNNLTTDTALFDKNFIQLIFKKMANKKPQQLTL